LIPLIYCIPNLEEEKDDVSEPDSFMGESDQVETEESNNEEEEE
jgi:hypothetical protein